MKVTCRGWWWFKLGPGSQREASSPRGTQWNTGTEVGDEIERAMSEGIEVSGWAERSPEESLNRTLMLCVQRKFLGGWRRAEDQGPWGIVGGAGMSSLRMDPLLLPKFCALGPQREKGPWASGVNL